MDGDNLSLDAAPEDDQSISSKQVDFDYDVTLVFSSEDGAKAAKIEEEMSQVMLGDRGNLRVCLYNDPTFGPSIPARPRCIVQRSCLVLVLVTEHTLNCNKTTFTKNETLGYMLSSKAGDQRHCVRPLLIQNTGQSLIPAGLDGVEPVHWYQEDIPRWQRELAKIVMCNRKMESQSRCKIGGVGDLDASAEPCPAVGAGDDAQGGAKPTHSPQSAAHIKYKDPHGGQYEVTLQGVASGIVVGHHNKMTVFQTQPHKEKMKTKTKTKTNKLPITKSSAKPSRKALEIVSSEIGKSWKKLGRSLGVSSGQLETIQLDYHDSGQEEVVYQMLRRWTERSECATLAELAQVCVDVGRGDIADMLTSLERQVGHSVGGNS